MSLRQPTTRTGTKIAGSRPTSRKVGRLRVQDEDDRDNGDIVAPFAHLSATADDERKNDLPARDASPEAGWQWRKRAVLRCNRA